MLLVDANVLLHAVNEAASEHDLARAWLAGALEGAESIGLAWMALLAFLRLGTHSSVFPRPMSVEFAAGIVEAWLVAPASIVVEPTRRHLPILRGLLAQTGSGGNLVADAHLAALALEHDATIVTFERDFGRFDGLRWRLPA